MSFQLRYVRWREIEDSSIRSEIMTWLLHILRDNINIKALRPFASFDRLRNQLRDLLAGNAYPSPGWARGPGPKRGAAVAQRTD